MMVEFEVPVKIVSEANQRCHWAVRRKRFAGQADAVQLAFAAHCRPNVRRALYGSPCAITLTRIGPRRLDSDNAIGGFKSVRDTIARLLGIDDGDERLTWTYTQEKGKPKEYGIRVRIETHE